MSVRASILIVVLAAMLLPALAKTKFKAKVINCTSNYKQWGATANMYAGENKDHLPQFGTGGAGNPWDTGSNIVLVLQPYGLTVPMWFCPARPDETAAMYNAAANLAPPNRLQNVTDLAIFMSSYFTSFAVINHCLWIKRGAMLKGSYLGTDSYNLGFLDKVTDRAAAKIPFISDPCFAGYPQPQGTNTSFINIKYANNLPLLHKYSGHVYNGRLQSLNLGFCDGHVEAHVLSRHEIIAQYDVTDNATWFY